MRLWELEGGDGADVGNGFAGGIAAPPWEAEEFDSDSDDESDLSDEDFEEFGGDDVVAWDDDTDDDEPAPDQRRANRPHIEIVNFAGNGVNRRIDLPNGAAPALALPAAPNPPHVNRRGRGNARGRGGRRGAARAAPRNAQPIGPLQAAVAVRAPPVIPIEEVEHQAAQVAAAPGQGNNANANLQRFLRLALEDREDEWDSDEDEAHPEPIVGRRAGNRRR